MLAVILIPHEATDLAGENILNWRARPAVSSPVGTSDISDDAVTSAKIATGAVGSDEIADTSIATADIADAAITAAKIGTGEVTTTELADGTIATADIASGAVTSTEISDGTIASADIGSGAVTTSEISDGTIADVDIDSTTTIARGKLDDERITTGAVTANTTTSGEEVVFVDTSGGAVTITLASADVADGNFVTIIDVGGASSSNNVTVDTESSETIDGASSDTISTDYGAAVYASDGTNWFSAGGGGGGGSTTDTRTDVADDGSSVQTDTTTINVQAGLSASSDGSGGANVNYEHAEVFEGRESGTVSDTNQGVLIIDHLADTEAVEVYKAALVNADGSAVATGVDLKLVTMDNAGAFTAQATLITGDGSTVFDDETGSPLGSYTNSSGGGQTIAVLVDNASGGSVDIMASVEGVTGV